MPTELIFTSQNILKSTIRQGGSLSYRVTTETTFQGRHSTILQWNSEKVGAIYWNEDEFEIDGERRPFSTLSSVAGSMSASSMVTSSGGQMMWWSGESYQILLSGDQVKAIQNRQTVACFTPYRAHIFQSDERASIQIGDGISLTDKIFLILVFIYADTKKNDAKESRTTINREMTRAMGQNHLANIAPPPIGIRSSFTETGISLAPTLPTGSGGHAILGDHPQDVAPPPYSESF